MSKKQNKLITKEILNNAIKGAFLKFDPRFMVKNPVMFMVEVGSILTLILSIFPTLCRRKNKISIWKNKTSIKVEILFFYKP